MKPSPNSEFQSDSFTGAAVCRIAKLNITMSEPFGENGSDPAVDVMMPTIPDAPRKSRRSDAVIACDRRFGLGGRKPKHYSA
jgi:hypothetical protein